MDIRRGALPRISRTMSCVVVALLITSACDTPGPEPVTISLVESFSDAVILNAFGASSAPLRVEWQFDAEPTLDVPYGLAASHGGQSAG